MKSQLKTSFISSVSIVAAFLVFGFAKEISFHNMQQLHWLSGTWFFKEGDDVVYEHWDSVNDSLMQGRSYAIHVKSNGMADTIIFETIQLALKNKKLQYIPTVNGQNGGKPVAFQAVEQSGGKIVFSNPSHDFPQYISYERIGGDSLVAAIWGKQGERDVRQEFKMQRVKK